jgi:biotin carboxyl carrier protein
VSDRPDVDVVSLGGGRFDVVEGLRHRPAFAVRTGTDTWVHLDGRVHVVSARPSASDRRARPHGTLDDEVALSAPMPATVVSVNVAVGQQVSRGDALITLEAMKMELAVRAPRDGTIKRINCKPGELVQPGIRLIEIQ